VKDFLNWVCQFLTFVILVVLFFDSFYYMEQCGWFFYSTYASGAVNHLDYLGVQVAWISGPWFLSIFVNMLPWESGEVYVVCIYKIDFFHIVFVIRRSYLLMTNFVYSFSSLGCASIRRKSCYAVSNSTCFNGVIWY
jgi:hypothetical protein